MNTLEIVPTKSVCGVEFGNTRTAIEALFGKPAKTFKKSKWSKGETADYGNFHIYYDARGAFEAIEIFESEVRLPKGQISIPSSKDTVIEALPSLKVDEYGLTSSNDSIGTSIEEGKVVSILFGKPGYYA